MFIITNTFPQKSSVISLDSFSCQDYIADTEFLKSLHFWWTYEYSTSGSTPVVNLLSVNHIENVPNLSSGEIPLRPFWSYLCLCCFLGFPFTTLQRTPFATPILEPLIPGPEWLILFWFATSFCWHTVPSSFGRKGIRRENFLRLAGLTMPLCSLAF